MVKGKGKSKGHDTKGNDGSRYYLLVDPRPGEAPDHNNSTLVQCTGTGRSPVHNRDVMDNTLHSQHLKDEGTGRVSRPTSLLFLSASASSYSSPTILASLSFPSAVWNSSVV